MVFVFGFIVFIYLFLVGINLFMVIVSGNIWFCWVKGYLVSDCGYMGMGKGVGFLIGDCDVGFWFFCYWGSNSSCSSSRLVRYFW